MFLICSIYSVTLRIIGSYVRATPVFSLKRTCTYSWILLQECPQKIILLIDKLYRITGIGFFHKLMTRGACRVLRKYANAK